MKIEGLQKIRFVGKILSLVLLLSLLVLPAAALAERSPTPTQTPTDCDFTSPSKQLDLVKAAIKFIQDNEGTNPTNADDDLTSMLKTNVAGGKKQLRQALNKPLGFGGTTPARIRIGLPNEGDVNSDIATADGFWQVKTTAQTAYHEWVHSEQFRCHSDDVYYACVENWAKCEPFWLEIEAYYKEIELKLQWKLAREKRLAEIPGPPTPEQQAEAERLDREIDQLKYQINDVINNYLDPPAPNMGKSYESNGNHLKAAFQGKTTNQEKLDEVEGRLKDISKIIPTLPQQSIEDKITAKVIAYRDWKKFWEEWPLFPDYGGTIRLASLQDGYSHFFEMTVEPGTLYAPTNVTVAYISPEYMYPWRDRGYAILSPVYQVSAPVGAMANPAHPARVTLSYNKSLAGDQTFHLYQMRAETEGRPLWEALPGKSIDYNAGTISGDSDDPFALYVVMAEPKISTGCNNYWSLFY